MAHPIILGDQVWCPRCGQYRQLVKIAKAARVADVSCKTIYRYIEEGKVHSVKVAGYYMDTEYNGEIRRTCVYSCACGGGGGGEFFEIEREYVY